MKQNLITGLLSLEEQGSRAELPPPFCWQQALHAMRTTSMLRSRKTTLIPRPRLQNMRSTPGNSSTAALS